MIKILKSITIYLSLLICSTALSMYFIKLYLNYNINEKIKMMNSGRFKDLNSKIIEDLSGIPQINILPFKPTDIYLSNKTEDTFVIKIDSNRDGKVLFINVWETWCIPCVAEFPALSRVMKDYYNTNTSFYFVSSEPIETITKFKESKNFDLPFYSLGAKTNIKKGSLLFSKSIPFTLIVIPHKKLILRINGAINWDDPSVRAFLDSYLQ